MKKIKDIRLDNLKLLIEEAGSVSKLAKIAGYNQPSYLYQVVNQSAIQNGKPKNIGDNMARKLENAMGKESGWMDVVHQTINAENMQVSTNYGQSTNNFSGTTYNLQMSDKAQVENVSTSQLNELYIKALPLFDIGQAVDYVLSGFDDKLSGESRSVATFVPHGNYSFGLKMSDKSMYKPGHHASIQKGDLLIIEPEIAPRDGDIVLVSIKNESFRIDLIALLSVSLSGQMSIIQIGKSDKSEMEALPEDAVICGVVLETKHRFVEPESVKSRLKSSAKQN